MKIFGWMADNAGCAWYRLMLPLGTLREAGHECRWSGRMEREDWESDVIIAQRTCLPGPSGRFQELAKARGQRPLLVYELDDDLLSIDRLNHPGVVELYGRPDVRANIAANAAVADLVTVSTEPLAEKMRKYNPNVVVLPNYVPGPWLNWQPGRYLDRITIGWQGSPTHDGDWHAASKPVKEWFDREKDRLGLEMHSIGSLPNTFPEVYPHRRTPWNPEIFRYYYTIDWHIALAPLTASIFNTSKSDIRVKEAGMLGVPIVASDVAAYHDSVIHGETGFLARKGTDWGKYLTILASDHDLRDEMSRRARENAMKYAIEDNAHRWLEAYENV